MGKAVPKGEEEVTWYWYLVSCLVFMISSGRQTKQVLAETQREEVGGPYLLSFHVLLLLEPRRQRGCTPFSALPWCV